MSTATNPFDRLLAKALRLLSYRPRSRQEIATRLQGDPAIISAVIDKLKTHQLLDDRQFAEWFIDQRLTHRPKGPLALRAELAAKGIDRQLADQVIRSKLPPDLQRQLARQLLTKKHFSAPQQAYSFLARRGFPLNLINQVIDEA